MVPDYDMDLLSEDVLIYDNVVDVAHQELPLPTVSWQGALAGR